MWPLVALVTTRTINLTLISVKVNDDGDTILVQAVKVKSERTDKLVAIQHTNNECCPLCRLNLRRLDYTVSTQDGQ